MRAVVYHGPGDIRLDNIPEPNIQGPDDAIVGLTQSAICGTDLHMIRDTMPGMQPGTVLGHEGVGIVEEVGPSVRNFARGDRVVIASTIACGACTYCRDGYYAQCDNANPNGKRAGTAFYGAPAMTGPFNGLQAEYARIPFAHTGLVPIPGNVSDEQAILISDVYPTGWFGARLADIGDGDTVAVFGCGPVGLFAIVSAFQQGAGRVIAVDGVSSRLEHAKQLHAEVVNFNREDPVQTILHLTDGNGTDRVIDAVGVDSERPKSGPAAKPVAQQIAQFDQERAQFAPTASPQGKNWIPGDAPSLVSQWAVQSIAKAGNLSTIGVYSPTVSTFPYGMAMQKNLTIKMGNCNHRRYMAGLLRMVSAGVIDPTVVVTQEEPLTDAITAYQQFDRRESGWTKVILEPSS